MKKRAMGVLLLAMLAGGCADDGSMAVADGPRPDMGPDGPPPPTLSIAVEGSAIPEVDDEVEVWAVVSGPGAAVKSYQWEVTDPGGAKLSVALNEAGDRVHFTPKVAGTFFVACTVTLEGSGETLTDSASVQVQDAGKKLTYTARVIPSPVSGLPPSDVLVEVGRASQTHLGWQLSQGREVSLEVVNSADTQLPTVVRLIQPGDDPIPRELYLEQGKGKVRVNGTFHALFLPEGEVSPDLRPNNNAGSMSSSWKVQLTDGLAIAGTVKHDGVAVPGAKITIHTTSHGVVVPSTIGTTSSQGGYSVLTRAGTATVTVVPPEGSGLPVALVQDPGLAVATGAAWDFSFAPAKPVTLTGKVTTSDGATAAAGAKVVLTTTIDSTVGTLDLPKVVKHDATGLFRRVLTSGPGGELKDPQSGAIQVVVPQGQYQVEVWPGPSASTKQGYTLSLEDLGSVTSKALSLRLGSRVTLKGTVVDQDGAPVQARVVASASMGSFSTTSDDKGEFDLSLNDKSSYSLVIRSTSKLVSTYIDPELKIDGSHSLPTIKLPRAVLLAGKVTTAGNLAISGSLIRIWCSGADCRSHAIADETTVAKNGLFELRVPPTEQK